MRPTQPKNHVDVWECDDGFLVDIVSTEGNYTAELGRFDANNVSCIAFGKTESAAISMAKLRLRRLLRDLEGFKRNKRLK